MHVNAALPSPSPCIWNVYVYGTPHSRNHNYHNYLRYITMAVMKCRPQFKSNFTTNSTVTYRYFDVVSTDIIQPDIHSNIEIEQIKRTAPDSPIYFAITYISWARSQNLGTKIESSHYCRTCNVPGSSSRDIYGLLKTPIAPAHAFIRKNNFAVHASTN